MLSMAVMRHVQLRAFHHVAVCGGFSRAAEALSLTQPAVSDQVRRLEAEYEVLLFSRQRRQVVLTRAGQRLLEITYRLFETEKQALELLSEQRALRSGSLRIMADSVAHLADGLLEFRAAYPGIELSIRTGNTDDILAALRAYESDLGVVGETPPETEFEVLRLNATPLIGFAAAGHPAAATGPMRLADLLAQPLVLREPGSRTRRLLESAAAARGLEVVAAIETEGREAVREIVARGAGIGVVSRAEFTPGAGLAAIPLSDCHIEMTEALVCLRERSGGRLIRAFIDCVRRAPGSALTWRSAD